MDGLDHSSFFVRIDRCDEVDRPDGNRRGSGSLEGPVRPGVLQLPPVRSSDAGAEPGGDGEGSDHRPMGLFRRQGDIAGERRRSGEGFRYAGGNRLPDGERVPCRGGGHVPCVSEPGSMERRLPVSSKVVSPSPKVVPLSSKVVLYRHGRACPGHLRFDGGGADGRDTPGHDEERTARPQRKAPVSPQRKARSRRGGRQRSDGSERHQLGPAKREKPGGNEEEPSAPP